MYKTLFLCNNVVNKGVFLLNEEKTTIIILLSKICENLAEIVAQLQTLNKLSSNKEKPVKSQISPSKSILMSVLKGE